MRQSFGSVFMYNIIIVFLVILFAFIAGTISYNKGFRVNSKIVNSIEKYEGYNGSASGEIDRVLNIIGYNKVEQAKCPSKNGATAIRNINGKYKYCIYEFKNGDKYYSYGVLTYIDFDIPIIGKTLELPIYSKTDRIYKFNIR